MDIRDAVGAGKPKRKPKPYAAQMPAASISVEAKHQLQQQQKSASDPSDIRATALVKAPESAIRPVGLQKLTIDTYADRSEVVQVNTDQSILPGVGPLQSVGPKPGLTGFSQILSSAYLRPFFELSDQAKRGGYGTSATSAMKLQEKKDTKEQPRAGWLRDVASLALGSIFVSGPTIDGIEAMQAYLAIRTIQSEKTKLSGPTIDGKKEPVLYFVQPPTWQLPHNINAAKTSIKTLLYGSAVAGLVDGKTPAKAASYAQELATFVNRPEIRDSTNLALWWNPDDWNEPTRFFYPGSSQVETIEGILSSCPVNFRVIVVSQRSSWFTSLSQSAQKALDERFTITACPAYNPRDPARFVFVRRA